MVSGALNPLCKQAIDHAERVYESIRKQSTDVERIAVNTGFSYEQVTTIKGHIFYNMHILPNGLGRFDPSYEISESWRRLSGKDKSKIMSFDILMLQHELLEISYILKGYSQKDAHNMTVKQYDYGTACNNYYRSLGFRI